ncbi:MAG: hypothetical protein U9R75_12765 [Candidatus Thermoplasmatota archaeon]|nr:hypothetical protein [Candidatus Thermoplasmatota archaeon]
MPDLTEYYHQQWGSNPNRKDIFVEVDWMHEIMEGKWVKEADGGGWYQPEVDFEFRFHKDAQYKVVNSFEHHEISLHIDARFAPTDQRSVCILGNKFPADDGCMGGGDKIDYEESTTFDEFDDIKEENFDWDKRGKIFHYCLFCKDTRDSKGTHWGIAEKLNIKGTNSYNSNYHGTGIEVKDADDFMVKSEAGKFLNPDKAERQAGVFMHELGHNLGLMLDRDNDGLEDQDRLNPNPKTCMNYMWIIYHVDYTSTEWEAIMPAGIQYAKEGH